MSHSQVNFLNSFFRVACCSFTRELLFLKSLVFLEVQSVIAVKYSNVTYHNIMPESGRTFYGEFSIIVGISFYTLYGLLLV